MKRALALPLQLLRPRSGLLARFAVTSLGRAALTGASILLIRRFLAGVLGESHGLAGRAAAAYGAATTLWGIAALLVLTIVCAAAFTYDSRVTEQKIVKVLELGAMERLIRHLVGLSVGFFDRRTHGDLLQTVRQDVTQLRIVAVAAANVVLEALQAGALVAAAASLSPRLALWAFLLVPLAALPIAVVARRTLVRSYGVRRKGVALFDVLLELLRGIRIIKIYQGERVETERTTDRARRYFDELIVMPCLAQFVLLYLHTEEAFVDYMKCLKPGGVLAILRFGETEALRLRDHGGGRAPGPRCAATLGAYVRDPERRLLRSAGPQGAVSSRTSASSSTGASTTATTSSARWTWSS